jgi:hypothetical protein
MPLAPFTGARGFFCAWDLPAVVLLRRYAMDFLSIRAFGHDAQKLLKDRFRLNKFDAKTVFCTWNHFVLVGMYGQTEAARQPAQPLDSLAAPNRFAGQALIHTTCHTP